MSNLYIFDSATGENLGPYPVAVGIIGGRGETDVILAPGPTPFPHYAIIHSEDGNVSFTSLSASSGMSIAATLLDPNFFSVPYIEEFNPNNTVGTRASAVIWGISAAAAVAFMILCFWSLHQYKRRQAQRNAAVLPVENAGVHRPGEEIDFELPAYTSTPEYANYIHPEDLAHIQRVNNLSLANQDSNNPPGESPEGGANADVGQAEGDAAGSEASLETPSSESPSTIVTIPSEVIPTDEPPAYYKDDDDRA